MIRSLSRVFSASKPGRGLVVATTMASIETGWLTITGLEVIVLEEVVQPVRFSRAGRIKAKMNQQKNRRAFVGDLSECWLGINEKISR